MATRLRIWLLTLSTLLVSLVAVASPARADTCTQGTFGCPWTSGTFATHTQDDWGTAPALTTHFADVYPSNILDVGGSWLSGNGYYLEFYDPASVAGFLPMTTAPGPLTQYVYPPELTYYTAGRFGTNVTSLKLNVDFGARGYLAHPAGQNLTDLRICNTTGLPVSAGTSVGAVLFVASQMLANQAPYSNNDYTAWDTLVALLNAAFDNGLPSSWAKDHLRTGSCPNVSLSISSSGQPVAGGINRFVAHVTDAANGAPIANASVVLRLEPGSVNAPYGTSAPTNSSG